MKSKGTLVTDISKRFLENIGSSGICADSIGRYERIILNYQQFCDNCGKAYYDTKVNQLFLHKIKKEFVDGLIPKKKYYAQRRVITAFEDFYNTGSVKVRYSYGSKYRWNIGSHYNMHLLGYVSSLKMSLGSKRSCESIVREFFFFLENKGVDDATKITNEDFRKHIAQKGKSYSSRMSNYLLAMRKLIGYLKDIVGVNIDDKVIALKGRRGRRRVFQAFSDDEMVMIINQPDLETKQGMRDYAIILLATFTGLRAIDIANLKLKDVDWLSKTLNIVQHKTGVPNSLPLEQKVLSSIARYILLCRPKTSSENLFITLNAPFRRLNEYTSVRNIIVFRQVFFPEFVV